MPIEVIALKSHSPDGLKRYKAGDRYQISSPAAKVLAALKFVRIVTSVEETTVVAPKHESKPRKTYERRDMRAED